MKIKVETGKSTLVVDTDNLKGADYYTEDYYRNGQDGTEHIIEEDDGQGGEMLVAWCDSNPWEAYSWDIDGKIFMIEDNSDGGRVYIGYDEATATNAETGDEMSYWDIIAALRDSRVDVPRWESVKHDYKAIATKYYEEAPGNRYYIDEERGFANEWTLHIVKSDDVELDGDLRKMTDKDEIINAIADAAMSSKDYEGEYGAKDCVNCVIH